MDLPSGPCSVCPPGHCGGHSGNNPDSCGGCGHTHTQHEALPQSTPSRIPLPPRGAFPMNGCTLFLGTAYNLSDLCQRTRCNARYQSHYHLPPSADSHTPPTVVPWSNPFNPSIPAVTNTAPESVNDRRMAAAIRHRPNAFGTVGTQEPQPVPNSRPRRTAPRRNYPTGTTIHQGRQAFDMTVEIIIFPVCPFTTNGPVNLEYEPPSEIRMHHGKQDVQIDRARSMGFNGFLTLSSMDLPSVNFNKIDSAVEEIIAQGLYLPPPLSNHTHRKKWTLMEAGNSPRNGGNMRKYRPVPLAERPPWWSFPNIEKVFNKGWLMPPPIGRDPAQIQLILAPQFGYGMRVIQGGLHPCTCMKFLCNMDEGTLSIDDMDDDFHLQSCPPIAPTTSSPLLMPVPLGLGTLSAPLSTSSTAPASRTSYTSAPPSALARRRRSPSIEERTVEELLLPPPARRQRLLGPTSEVSETETATDSGTETSPNERLMRPINAVQLQNIIHAQIAPSTLAPGTSFRLTAPSNLPVPTVAQVLFDWISYQLGGTYPDLHGVVLENSHAVIQRLLLTSTMWIKLGRGVGSGPARQLISSTTEMIFDMSGYWSSVNDRFMTLRTSIPPTPRRLQIVKTFGAVVAIYIAQFGSLPEQLSPVFLQAILHGSASADDIDWYREVAPEVAAIMALWPANERPAHFALGTTEPSTIGLSTLLADLGVTVQDLDSYHVDDVENLRKQAINKALLDTSPGVDFDESSYSKAFRSGFNIPFGRRQRFSMMKAMGHSTKVLLKSLTPMVINDPAVVYEKLSWIAQNPSSGFSDIERKFKICARRWIFGDGHPDHPNVSERISHEQRQAALEIPAFRARCFIQYVTGCKLLAQCLMKFVRPPPRSRSTGVQDPTESDEADDELPATLFTHVCDKQVEIPLSAPLRNMVSEAYEAPEGQVTKFELWMHDNFVLLESSPVRISTVGFSAI